MIQLSADRLHAAGNFSARWRWAVPALLLAVGAAVFGFWAPLAAAVDTWSGSPSYEHGYAIAAIVAVLIWAERYRLVREAPRPSLWGVALSGAAAALGALGAAATVQVAEQLAFVLFLNGAVLAILGTRIWRILAFPLVYLFFAVPAGDVLLPWLRGVAAHAIVAMLDWTGTPAVLDGYLIRLPSADYHVAEACAGLRFLLVSVAAGVLAARLLLRSRSRRLVFLAVAAILPLAANALRSALLIGLAARGMLDPASAALHLTYGLGFTSIILILLMVLAWSMREAPAAPEPTPMASGRPAPPLRILAAALPVTLLAFLPGTITGATSPPVEPPRLATPSVGGGWTQEAASAELLEKAALAGADATLAAAWSGEDALIELLILYYRRERQGAEAVGADLPSPLAASWTEIDARRTLINLRDGSVEALAGHQQRAGAHRIVWTWYWVDGRFTGNAFTAKLRQIAARLLHRADASARLQLVVSGPAARGEVQGIVDRFLAELGPIGPLLETASPPTP